MAPPKKMKEHWLVTGGAGFLGHSLVRRLLAEGQRVTIYDNEPAPAWVGSEVDYVQADIRDAGRLLDATRGADYVLHTAAALPIHRSKKFILDVNVNGTRNVLEAALQNQVKGVVFTSSTAVYGLPKVHPITEESPMKPVGPYGTSKVRAEELCREYRAKGLHIGIVRAKTFLGPGRLGVFEILFDWIRRGKKIYLIGKGHNKYQLMDVDDLIDGMLLMARNRNGNDAFNLGAQSFGTLREDLTALLGHANTRARLRSLPKRTTISTLFVLDKLRLSPLTRWHYGTMATDSYVETDKAQRLLGWKAKRTNRETLIATYDWYIQHQDEIAGRTGKSHTVPWSQGILKFLRGLS